MVNFELGEKFEKVLFRLVTSVGPSKKKIRVLMQNRTSDLQIWCLKSQIT